MLPVVLVLLVATSALAAPFVNIAPRTINSVVLARDNGNAVSRHAVEAAMGISDGGDNNVYVLLMNEAIGDLANQPDRRSQALAVSQAIAVLSKLATGVTGDACASANLINAYVNSLQTGNSAGVSSALQNYVRVLVNGIDQIVQLATNPNAARFAVGSRGNCYADGRTYQFEAAWDAILDNTTPANAAIVNEQYCAAKRLYSAFNARTNTVGTSITAASLPVVIQMFQQALPAVATFLRALATSNPAGAAAAAKSAILSAAVNYS